MDGHQAVEDTRADIELLAAEEVLQEVFLTVWTKAGTYDQALGSPVAWLVRIARNRGIDRLRAEGVRTRNLDDTDAAVAGTAAAPAADAGVAPDPDVKARLMARVQSTTSPTLLPAGFRIDLEIGGSWQPHPVPGIRMRVLSLDRERDYATLLLDVARAITTPQSAIHRSTASSRIQFNTAGLSTRTA